MANSFNQYLEALKLPFHKLAKLEFLQPDNSVAFSLDNNFKRGYRSKYDTRAFIQGGTLNVSMQNGQRRKATVTLANIDGAFEYAVNKVWFGQRIRLSMGLVLPDGSEFYLPQGVFYINNPQSVFKPNSQQITYNLVDKWAYLDGTLFGNLYNTFLINRETDGVNTNIFKAMQSVLSLSKMDLFTQTTDVGLMVDSVLPVFTTYYNGKTYSDGSLMTDIPYTLRINATEGTLAKVLLELNEMLVAWIGYDQTGALRVDSSQTDINDAEKPILWTFSPENSNLLGITETAKNSEVFNHVLIIGEGLNGGEVYGEAKNFNPTSDTNINLIGLHTYREAKATYWNAQQCTDLAEWYLKRKTALQKSITIESSQMFHLIENRLVAIKRTDKQGSPVERHLIESFTLPIGETGSMSINAASIYDIQN